MLSNQIFFFSFKGNPKTSRPSHSQGFKLSSSLLTITNSWRALFSLPELNMGLYHQGRNLLQPGSLQIS